jgi:hypothetical protein
MRPEWTVAAIAIWVGAGSPAIAGVGPIPGLTGTPANELAGDLRGLLLKNMPDPLYEAAPNWGHQRDRRSLQLSGERGEGRVEIVHGPKNDGVWRKIRITAPNPADNLVFDLRDVRSLDAGKIAFTVFVAADLDFNFTQQRWFAGVRLFDASAKARARVKITLDCQATTRIEPTKELLPDVVFVLQVTKADLRYDNLVFEHIAGIGGDAARIIGEAAQAFIKEWRPQLERDLLARANAAIVKAGENKEVRISLSKMLKTARPAAPPAPTPAKPPSP